MSYKDQVALLLQILPETLKNNHFALKGGTAINLFFREMPRYSVDIDLTPTLILNREKTILLIHNEFLEIHKRVTEKYSEIRGFIKKSKDGYAKQIRFFNENSEVKVETSNILRGYFSEIVNRDLCQKAQNEFNTFISVNCMSFEDVYAGKICAGLDRQHPRDLYDIKLLLDNEGYSEKLHKAFILYMLSGNRPISEMISPNRIDITTTFERQFDGMAFEKISLEDLKKTRENIINLTKSFLTDLEKEFLISFKKGEPKWELSGIPNIEQFPSVQWKLINVRKMSKEKRELALQELIIKLSFLKD